MLKKLSCILTIAMFLFLFEHNNYNQEINNAVFASGSNCKPFCKTGGANFHYTSYYSRWKCPKFFCGKGGESFSHYGVNYSKCKKAYLPTKKIRCYNHEKCSICGRERDDKRKCKETSGIIKKCWVPIGHEDKTNYSEKSIDGLGCKNNHTTKKISWKDCSECKICGYDWKDFVTADSICPLPVGLPFHTHRFHQAYSCKECKKYWLEDVVKIGGSNGIPGFDECKHHINPLPIKTIVCDDCPDLSPNCNACRLGGCSACPEEPEEDDDSNNCSCQPSCGSNCSCGSEDCPNASESEEDSNCGESSCTCGDGCLGSICACENYCNNDDSCSCYGQNGCGKKNCYCTNDCDNDDSCDCANDSNGSCGLSNCNCD